MVDKAKYVWLIVGQLPIKAGWWNAPLTLRDFSRSNKHEDSHKESPWFPAFPPWFSAFTSRFSAFPPPFPSFPAFLTFPPPFLAFPPDSPHSHPDSPRSHPDSLRSLHSPYSVPRFPIPAFTDSLFFISFGYL